VFTAVVALPPVVGVLIPLIGLGGQVGRSHDPACSEPRRSPPSHHHHDWCVSGGGSGGTPACTASGGIGGPLHEQVDSHPRGCWLSLQWPPRNCRGTVSRLFLPFRHPALYQTVVVLVFAYAVLFMPKALGTARASIEGVSVDLVNVARTLGASRFQAWRRVTVPLALPGIGIGALLVAITTMKELPATLLLRPLGSSTLATELWSRTAAGEFGAAAPYAAVLVVVAAIPAMILSGVRSVAKEEM
jgi:ABC-type proline/glycine betaine transport system permease subunit